MSELSLDEFSEDIPAAEFVEDSAPRLGHLSHSQISTYQSCPRMYYWRYERKIKTDPAAAMVFGSAIHATLENNFSQKVLSRRDLPVSVSVKHFKDAWNRLALTAVFDADKNESPENFLEQGVAMIEKYQEEMSPNIMPKLVEVKFTLRLPGLRREILGFIDLVDDSDVIIDHKTSKMQPNNVTLAKNTQLTLYKLAFRKKFGKEPGGLRYDYLIRQTNRDGSYKGISILPIPIEKNAASEAALIASYISVEKAIEMKHFHANTGHFGCTPSGCGNWSACEGAILSGGDISFLDDIAERQKAAYKRLIETGVA
jgi:RecB family exonuclease